MGYRKYVITIEAEYDSDTTADPHVHASDLTNEVQRAIGEGLLTPHHRGWEVGSYEFDVRHEGDDDEYGSGNSKEGNAGVDFEGFE